MTRIEKHINKLFSMIPNSSKARKRKAQLLEESKVKFEKLKKRKKTDEEAQELVINEISTLDELREELPATGTLTNIIAAVFFVIFFAACVISAYFRISEESFEKMFEAFFEYIKIAFARPMRWGTGGFLILWTLARYSKIGPAVRIKKFPLRMLALVLSAVVLLFYIMLFVFIWFGICPSFTNALMPICKFLWREGHYIFVIPGAALFLGLRR